MITQKQKTELKNLKNKYFSVKEKLKAIQLTSKRNEKKILFENKFYDDKGKRVLNDADNIEDLNEFKKFLNLLFIENKKAGLQVTDPDLVPEWKEKKQLRQLEDQLLELQLEITPKKYRKGLKQAQKHWKYRKECLNLILKLAI